MLQFKVLIMRAPCPTIFTSVDVLTPLPDLLKIEQTFLDHARFGAIC
jgi:hypothetical protein